MKNIKKLTPAILKKIISEEKSKLQSKKNNRKNLSESQKLAKQIALIKKIELRQRKYANNFKKLYEARNILKKRLMRDL